MRHCKAITPRVTETCDPERGGSVSTYDSVKVRLTEAEIENDPTIQSSEWVGRGKGIW